MEAAAKKRHPLRIVAWTLGIALALAVAAVVALNIYVRVAFGPFYDQAERVFDIPGVNAGFNDRISTTLRQPMRGCSAAIWPTIPPRRSTGAMPTARLRALR